MLSVIPALTVLMVATNNLHHLMFRQVEWFQSDSFYLISRKFGPWFWIHTAYSYILLFLGFIFIAKSLMDAQRAYTAVKWFHCWLRQRPHGHAMCFF